MLSLALKSGESVNITELYWVTNCRSLLTGIPEVTILEGPPGVTASVTDAMVLPRFQQCSAPVKGRKTDVDRQQDRRPEPFHDDAPDQIQNQGR